MAVKTENSRNNRALSKRKSVTDAALANTHYRWLILVGLILAAAMEVLDTTIINVALPQMAGNLSTTTQEIAWVSTGYILSNVVVLPMTAFFNSFFGRRNYLVGSIILFTVASVFCGTSRSLVELIIWRVLQGAGGAALISTAQATLVQVFPPEEQSTVQPLFLMGLVVFPTIGPSLGGFIADALNWNWCFFINIPIGIISASIVFFMLHDTDEARQNMPVDWAGIGLLTVGLASLQYILEEGQQNDWFGSPMIVRLSMISAISFVSLLCWLLSKRNTYPIINLRVLQNSSLSGGIVLFIAVGFGLYGVNYLFPILAQQQQGLSPLQTGLALLPGGIATAISIVFCGVMASTSLDARLQTLFGIILSVIGMYMLGQLGASSSSSDTFWPMIIRGTSVGFLFVPVNQMAIGSLNAKDVNEGTALLGLGRQLGGSIGIAIIATTFQNNEHINRANLVGDLTTNNPAYTERLSEMTGALVTQGYSFADAQHAALGMIDQIMTQQVSAKSFDDTFGFLMIVSILMIPTLLLLRAPKPGAATEVAMH
jgi:MFS transporter, DHA2 family, multidrug resistance protein